MGLLSCLNYPILWVFLVSLSWRVEFQLFSGVSLPSGGFVVFVSIVDVFSFSFVSCIPILSVDVFGLRFYLYLYKGIQNLGIVFPYNSIFYLNYYIYIYNLIFFFIQSTNLFIKKKYPHTNI